jgi:3-methyl-2-oxobutanoate hydroxymethyltransferase
VLGRLISERLNSVIVIGVGAGPGCDGQSVNLYDIIGLTQGIIPKFAKRYAEVAEIVRHSISEYVRESTTGAYPDECHTYGIDEETEKEIIRALEEVK